MTKEEREQLQAVLDDFDKKEDDCWNSVSFLDEHGFKFEKQVAQMKAEIFGKCFRKLNATLSRMKTDEWTEQDEAIVNEIIAFFRDGKVKLQHDLNHYASWLERHKGVLCKKED